MDNNNIPQENNTRTNIIQMIFERRYDLKTLIFSLIFYGSFIIISIITAINGLQFCDYNDFSKLIVVYIVVRVIDVGLHIIKYILQQTNTPENRTYGFICFVTNTFDMVITTILFFSIVVNNPNCTNNIVRIIFSIFCSIKFVTLYFPLLLVLFLCCCSCIARPILRYLIFINSTNNGVEESVIMNITERVVTNDDIINTCSVCLANYDIGETLKHLPCNHEFHKDCISPWLRMNKTCPLCRQDVTNNSQI
jgi:hypothetical protein